MPPTGAQLTPSPDVLTSDVSAWQAHREPAPQLPCPSPPPHSSSLPTLQASCLTDLNCSDPNASYCDPSIGGGCVPKSCSGVPACLDSVRWGNNQCNRCWSCATALCSALPASSSCDGFGNCLN